MYTNHIFLVFLFIKRKDRNPETGDRVSDVVNITTADYRRITPVGIQPPFDFSKVSLIHAIDTVLSFSSKRGQFYSLAWKKANGFPPAAPLN